MIFQNTPPLYPQLNDLLIQPEKELTESNLTKLKFLQDNRDHIKQTAKAWIQEVREIPLHAFNIQKFLQAFPLTEAEGRSLMTLAEAFQRIPDSYTANLLLKDKIVGQKWRKKSHEEDTLVSLSRWGLDLVAFLESHKIGTLTQRINLEAFKLFMKLLSHEFILGETIEKALSRRKKTPEDRFSFDMLGEGARTYSMAKAYKDAYAHAIETMRKVDNETSSPYEKDSISIKLSALHPHYNLAHHEEVMREILPDLIELCTLAKEGGIAVTIDAEEVARLELSLDLIEQIATTSELKGWDGFGLAIQAYQKRAPGVIEWIKELSQKTKKPLMVRLVKGAYWDTEIKISQVGGFPQYPVFTRKAATDLSYLACANQLLKAEGLLFPQFATHNAFTVAAILEMANGRKDIEFQRLQGMGQELYKVIRNHHSIPCRVYAPVGIDKDLLPYLVRRLLENGANSSFVHKIYDKELPPEEVMGDPFAFFENHVPGIHPKISLPQDLYGSSRKNSEGYDLDNRETLKELQDAMDKAGNLMTTIEEETPESLKKSLDLVSAHWESWDLRPAQERASILKKAADLLEERYALFLKLLITEAKKTLPDAVSEIREATDYCRYYAEEAIKHFSTPEKLIGPTGELNELSLHGRGVFACISPWNFPLAIFMGQVTAALAAGNGVMAKPASLTPCIAKMAVELLHDAGVPKEVLHFCHGKSSVIGDVLIKDQRIKGVVFTGSTSTAQHLQKVLTERGGPLIPLIAETGGLNTMIVDSSALLEQVVDDVISSAFQSAGQRCSALRLLYLQEGIYDEGLSMLREAMEALNVGNSEWISTDVGPVIDDSAEKDLEAYVKTHSPLARTKLHNINGTFVAPTLIELKGIEELEREVFGPILHVAPFKAKDLSTLVQRINDKGYGLTMGIESRIENTIQDVRTKAHVGNIYANRNIIGAVVGVQPFGGEGLSGTGPKAGGPFYLPRFAHERTFSYNITASGGDIVLMNLEEY